MLRLFVPVLITALSIFSSIETWAQSVGPDQPPRAAQGKGTARGKKVPMRNRVHVTVIEHIKEPHRYSETRQMGGKLLIQDGQGNEFGYDHYRVFKPLPKIESPLPVFTLTAGLSSQTITGSGGFVTLLDIGNPLVDPPTTKPVSPGNPNQKSILFGSSSDGREDSDSAVLYGPELTLPVKGDVTEWEIGRWLPANTALGLYGKALFGEFELFGIQSDLELYGVGVSLGMPVWSSGDLRVHASIGAGPGILRSDLGDAVGFDGSTGLSAEMPLVGNLAFVASAKLTLFAADNVHSWGPAISLGFVFAW